MRYATVAFLLALGASPISQASACGGFFCSSSPINQARETVVYGYEPDGSITMAVQITYSGRDEDFAWILPVPVAPDEIAVGTDALFQQLIAQTEPTFALRDAVEGQCARLACEYPGPGCSVGCGSAASPASSGGARRRWPSAGRRALRRRRQPRGDRALGGRCRPLRHRCPERFHGPRGHRVAADERLRHPGRERGAPRPVRGAGLRLRRAAPQPPARAYSPREYPLARTKANIEDRS